MATNHFLALSDAVIMTGEATVENHALLVRDGIIVDLVGNNHIPAEAQKRSCRDQILAPGLIDAQVNGGGNILLNNEPSVESCLAIATAHRNYGTTSLLLTCISDTTETTHKAAAAIREARKTDKSVLGLHLEGPHLSKDKRGVHSASAVRPLTTDDKLFYKRMGDESLLITLAPETIGPEDIRALQRNGAIIALGHTNAAADVVRTALASGATGFTHLYNGMGDMKARAPGVVGTALDDRQSWCGLIADGHHVAPEMIRLALRAKPQGKVFLVSDAMAPAATDKPQPFQLYGETIKLEASKPFSACVTDEGRLAGSAITLLDAVKHCVKNVGIELDEALRMASTYPAAFLGVGSTLGKLLPGHKADILGLTPDLELRQVF